MTPQLGSTSSRAVFFLFFLSAAAFVPPARSAPPACSAANMPIGPAAFAADNSLNLVAVLDASKSPVSVACTIAVGLSPTNLALSPDSSQLFVENDADATVTVVTLADPSVPANISTVDLTTQGVTKPMTANLAVSPDGTFVYVVSLPGTIGPTTQASLNVISLPSLTVAPAVSIVTNPAVPVTGPGLGVAFTPDATATNGTAYVATEGATYAIATATQTITILQSGGAQVIGGTVAVDPANNFAYVVDAALSSSAAVSRVAVPGNSVVTLSNVSPMCTQGNTTAITPNSARAYYTCAGSNFIQAIDTATNSSTAVGNVVVTAGTANPQGIAIAPDGVSAYVANNDGTVAIVDVGTNASSPISASTSLRGIGIRPVKLPSLSPTTATVPIGGSHQFTSSVFYAFSTGKTLIWAVNGIQGGNSTVGTIDSIGLYTAPSSVPNPAQVTVSVTSSEVPVISNLYPLTATVTVIPPTVSVTPKPATLDLSIATTLVFTATVANDPATGGVTFATTCSGPNPCGTFGAPGVPSGSGGNYTVTATYTAPGKINPPSSVQVTATSVSDTTVSDASTLSLSSDIVFSTIAFNLSAPLLIENPDTLSTTLTLDPYTQGVIWSIDGCSAATPATAACGSINASSGVFTPPSMVPYASQSNPQAPATVTFRATSVTDATKFSVTNPPVTITSNVAINGFQVNGAAPPSQLLIETASYTLTPVITGDTGQGVIWSILSCSVANPATSSCGKFTDVKAGTYVPPPIVPYATPVTPSSTASVTFQATSVADPLVSKTFTINIGSTIQLSMSASISNVLIGGSLDFTPKTTGGNVTLVNDTNQGVTLAITGTCFAPPNFGSSATIPCGSFNGNSYSAPPVVPLSSAPPASLSQATRAQITVTATSVADPVRVASTMFVISSNISFTVLLGVDTTTLQNTGPTAASPTLAVGGPTSGYNTAAYLESNAAGFGSVTGLNWQATAGNIQAASGNQSAMYTSPAAVPNPATVTITGFAIADFTKTATASIPIVASKFVYANASSIGSTVQITIPSNASSGSLNLDFLGPTSGQIALACSNFVQLTNSSCSFSPSATASSSATGKTLVTLTLSVTRSGGAYLRPPLAPGTPLPGLPGSVSVITLLTLLILVFVAKNRIRFLWAPASRWNRAFAVLLLCAVVLTWAAACGQFSQPNTPPPPIPPTQTATGSVTVTGTPTTNSSASTDSLVVMVQVN